LVYPSLQGAAADMFLEQFDAGGVIRGPAQQGHGAFVSREDAAQTAAVALLKQPGGIYDVTGPGALSVASVANRLSTLVGRPLRYKDESADATRARLSKLESLALARRFICWLVPGDRSRRARFAPAIRSSASLERRH
jgi:uncharacterized protein YbjT (DUF2867 family)